MKPLRLFRYPIFVAFDQSVVAYWRCIGTLAICLYFGMPFWIAPIDALIHYHIDWAKMRYMEYFTKFGMDGGT